MTFTRNPATGVRRASPIGISRRGKPYDSYVKLPDDDTLVALWEANNRNHAATADVIGCSPSTVGLRIRRLGLHTPRRISRGPTWQLGQEMDELAAGLVKTRADVATIIEAFSERLAALEAQPRGGGRTQIVEWRPDHRRKTDGGRPVRMQRRDMGLPKRLKAVS